MMCWLGFNCKVSCDNLTSGNARSERKIGVDFLSAQCGIVPVRTPKAGKAKSPSTNSHRTVK